MHWINRMPVKETDENKNTKKQKRFVLAIGVKLQENSARIRITQNTFPRFNSARILTKGVWRHHFLPTNRLAKRITAFRGWWAQIMQRGQDRLKTSGVQVDCPQPPAPLLFLIRRWMKLWWYIGQAALEAHNGGCGDRGSNISSDTSSYQQIATVAVTSIVLYWINGNAVIGKPLGQGALN